MTNVRQLSTLFFFSLFTILLTNCGNQKASTAQSTDDTGVTPTAEIAGLGDALDDIPTDTPEQAAAISTGKDALGDLSKSYGLLQTGQSPSQVLAFVKAIEAARKRAAEAAEALRAAGFAALADAFAEIAAKVNVLRFYQPSTGDHFFTLSTEEGFNATSLLGYTYEGVGFRVYQRERNGCNVGLYRCIQGTGSHFVSTAANCEGTKTEGQYGLVCKEKITRAWNPLHRLITSLQRNHHIATPSEQEKNAIVAAGGKYEGILGYTPN